RLNEEIRRRTYVVRIFPNTESCLRLVRALAVETNAPSRMTSIMTSIMAAPFCRT
ncbi:transposase, partial [Mesorhizobium sp. L2C066B000]|uniref:transposase n=2 Tax=unclassified Mesorhizobium TaxID=325217 RepID=UPI001FD9E56B